jgi:hypothetical protein
MPLSVATVVLASCASLPFHSVFSKPEPMATREVTAVPPDAREVPVQKPTVAVPAPTNPVAPQMAMNVPRPPLRPPTPMMKPTPPQEIEAVAPGDLVGSDFSAVRHVLREPDNIQNSALSVVWTYETDCTLQLYFYPDIKTRVFRVLKYDLKDSSGEKPANSNACMRSIMVAKSDEPASP